MNDEISFPLEIEFRHLDRSEILDTKIRENVAKLTRYYDRIMSCCVVEGGRTPVGSLTDPDRILEVMAPDSIPPTWRPGRWPRVRCSR